MTDYDTMPDLDYNVRSLIMVAEAYDESMYIDPAVQSPKHNLAEIINLVNHVSQLWSYITEEDKHRAIVELCRRWEVS